MLLLLYVHALFRFLKLEAFHTSLVRRSHNMQDSMMKMTCLTPHGTPMRKISPMVMFYYYVRISSWYRHIDTPLHRHVTCMTVIIDACPSDYVWGATVPVCTSYGQVMLGESQFISVKNYAQNYMKRDTKHDGDIIAAHVSVNKQ